MGVMRRREFLRAGLLAAAGLPCRGRAGSGTRVLVAGGGFAGGACALALRRLAPEIEVAVIDPHRRYVTCPMSNAVLAGLRTLNTLTLDRRGLEQSGIRYIEDALGDVDFNRQTAHLQRGDRLAYDRLVLAPGIRLLYGQPEGYDPAAALKMPHAWEAGPSTRLLAQLLHAVPDGGTVAISVPSGLMRCPPGPYERATLMAYWLTRHRKRCKVLIFDANNHFPRQDAFTDAWQELYPGLIEWIPPTEGGAITRVDAAARTLHSSSGAHRVHLANIIPPQAPGLIARAANLCSDHGWCPVDPVSFESQLARHVYVIGDACIAGAMPKAASAARSQALQCAAAVVASLSDQTVTASELESVCYCLLSPATGLALHARFRVARDRIEQIEGSAGSGQAVTRAAAHVAEANAWYQEIRTACFAA